MCDITIPFRQLSMNKQVKNIRINNKRLIIPW